MNPERTVVHVTRRLDPPEMRWGTQRPLEWEIGYVEAVCWRPDAEDGSAQRWMELTEVKHDA